MDHMIWVWIGYTLIIVVCTAFLAGGLAYYRGYKDGHHDGHRAGRRYTGTSRAELTEAIQNHQDQIGL